MQARTTRHETAATFLAQPDSRRYVGEPRDGDGAQGRQAGIVCTPHVRGIRPDLKEAWAGPLWGREPAYRSTGCSERALFD